MRKKRRCADPARLESLLRPPLLLPPTPRESWRPSALAVGAVAEPNGRSEALRQEGYDVAPARTGPEGSTCSRAARALRPRGRREPGGASSSAGGSAGAGASRVPLILLTGATTAPRGRGARSGRRRLRVRWQGGDLLKARVTPSSAATARGRARRTGRSCSSASSTRPRQGRAPGHRLAGGRLSELARKNRELEASALRVADSARRCRHRRLQQPC